MIPRLMSARLRQWIVRARLGEQQAATRELREFLKQERAAGEDGWLVKLGAYLVGEVSETQLFSRRNGHHAHFDLWEANRRQLEAAGVDQVLVAGLCTACRTDHFFSHRAERGRTGRFGVVIGYRE